MAEAGVPLAVTAPLPVTGALSHTVSSFGCALSLRSHLLLIAVGAPGREMLGQEWSHHGLRA
eukprot:6194873-Pleurochrysis_carterae.AAC.1